MKRKILWILEISAVVLLMIMGIGRYLEVQNRQTDPNLQIAEEIYKVETALKEVAKDYEYESMSKVTPFTYADSEGNTIVYYCCQTVYPPDESGEDAGLNKGAIGLVIDVDLLENRRECMVNGYDAFLCDVKDRTYLCWTLSPEISCLIEYSADSTDEDDIFRMAENISWPTV